MLPEKLSTHLENQIERFRKLGHPRINITGTVSTTALALLISQADSAELSSLPHLVVVGNDSEAQKFLQSLTFFDPNREVSYLPAFDVSPYSGLSPRHENVAGRCRFLWQAQKAKPAQVFVATVESLLQKTLSFEVFSKHCFEFKKDREVPSGLSDLLVQMGYQSTPLVEDLGQFSVRGGILDIFSPAHDNPVRLELFGDTIESLRFFDPNNQRSLDETNSFCLIPCTEFLWNEVPTEQAIERFRKSVVDRPVEKIEFEESLRALAREARIDGIDFLFPYFSRKTESPLNHFGSSVNLWQLDPIHLETLADQFKEEMQNEYQTSSTHLIRPEPSEIWNSWDVLDWPADSPATLIFPVEMREFKEAAAAKDIPYATHNISELSQSLFAKKPGSDEWVETLIRKLTQWKNDGYAVMISVRHQSQAERLRLFLDRHEWKISVVEEKSFDLVRTIEEQRQNQRLLHLIARPLAESVRIPEEKIVFLKDEDLWGKKTNLRRRPDSEEFQKQAKRLSFGDLKPGDCVVHSTHGIGVYDGLKIMAIGGAESEFIQISYKDKDKLYLPVYRIGQLNRYAGVAAQVGLDRLGSNQFEKSKTKVKSALRDLASDLLALYAKRAELHRPAVAYPENEYRSFEASFPYDETDDQLRTIHDLEKDLHKTTPMDRLICGDVGFGKTEVAMRAAFAMVSGGKQVAVLCPTTVLSFQHLETFKKRFSGWPIEIRALNRFVTTAEAKKTLALIKEGKVDILIGTHRILSKDVQFKDLGLLIIDEEQKFGVAHKEKIRKLRVGIDTVAMSATPIPRTLNMSLSGIRDLSLINTAPVDRLPTRTFITKWDPETIRKALTSEVQRGGQIYFIHNRVQSIYGVADELRQIVPELRMKVGHGQMEEHELEETMVAFFNHEIDVLICTTIVESGMDVPRANTMFIDQAHTLGLSQLYQLRGRVGRSKQRAYCYLLLPRNHTLDKPQQERLKVIQENTALGSGIRIAQYDLELRGAGNILGEAQSGHIDAVGYELYMELLSEAVESLKSGSEPVDKVEPEINLRIPALIPDAYIGDIRMRLSYYKALSEVRNAQDIDAIEEELRDQFGELPEPTLNLMGLMLIRAICKDLGIKDLSAGVKNISLLFAPTTPMKPETAIKLATKENKKYSLTPDNRLNIRMNEITWARVVEELELLGRQI